MFLCTLLVSIIFITPTSTNVNPTGPEDGTFDPEQMTLPGDLTLGAIFPIRSYGILQNRSYSFKHCGDLETTFVLQAEAFRLSVEYVNKNILKGYTLGGLVVDDCDNAVIGLQSAARLMAGEFDGEPNWGICSSFRRPDGANRTFIYGVTGGTNSVISERVEPLIEVYCLPLMSTYATAPVFSTNTKTYPYFLRTVPSDEYQARVVYDILRKMKWYTVMVIYENTPYGKGLYDVFRNRVNTSQLDDDSICITKEKEISTEAPQFDDVVNEIIQADARVVVVFTDFTITRGVFKHVKERMKDGSKRFQWVGTDGWSRTEATDGAEFVTENAITTEYLSYEIPLVKWMKDNLTFDQVSNSSNPWLKELVRTTYNCSGNHTEPFCADHSPSSHVELKHNDAGFGRSHYVFEAVYSFALAFEELRKMYCQPDDRPALCPAFYQYSNGSTLLNLLKSVKISDPSQLPREFMFHGNSGPPKYSVFQLQNSTNGFRWIPIGNWTEDNKLTLVQLCDTNSNLYSNSNSNSNSTCLRSVFDAAHEHEQCRAKCQYYQYKRTFSDRPCCWKCESCEKFQYVNGSGSGCDNCPMGEKPNHEKPTSNQTNVTPCIPDELVHLGLLYKPNLFWPILLQAVVGFFCYIFISIVFIHHRRTPAAILASFPLCVIATFASACLFGTIILTLLRPSDRLCLAQWSLQPFLLTFLVGAVFVRTFQFSSTESGRASYTIRRKSSILARNTQSIELAVICIFEGIIILAFHLFLGSTDSEYRKENSQPGTRFVHMERDRSQTAIACSSVMDIQHSFLFLIIPIVLLFISIIFALRNWKSPVLFERHENRRILWSCGLILIFLVFIAILVVTVVKSPIERTSTQAGMFMICGFIFLIHYGPIACIMLRGRKNMWIHLERDVKENLRIRSDQLTLADEVIGEGHFCEVRRGKYYRNKRQVVEIAAKMARRRILENRADLADLTDSLLQELVILLHIRDCENIVRLYGVCNDGESMILVFEYADGESCRKFVPARRSQLNITDLLSIAGNIADALCFLKEKSIVHRDVRSENCLVQEKFGNGHGSGGSPNGSKCHAKLGDFGLAVETNRGRADERRQRLFHERHTAPEGFRGKFSYESDVWSFGTFLWELFQLKTSDTAVPYENVRADKIETYIAAGNVVPKPESAPDHLYDNVMKPCWAYDPSKRIKITRLKDMIMLMMRKRMFEKQRNGSGGNGGNVNETSRITGSMWYGLNRDSTSVSTPDLLNGSHIINVTMTSIRGNHLELAILYPGSLGTTLDTVHYKRLAVSSKDISQRPPLHHVISAPHTLQPSIIVIDDEATPSERTIPPDACLYRKVM